MQTVVLATGLGTRMGPLSGSVPGPLLPVGDKPLVAHTLDAAADAGASDFILVAGSHADVVQETIGSEYRNIPIAYRTDDHRGERADAIVDAADRTDAPFALLRGDSLYRPGEIEELFANGPSIGVARVPDPGRFGTVALENGTVASTAEQLPGSDTTFAHAGASVLPREAIALLENGAGAQDSTELADMVCTLARQQEIAAVEFDGWMSVECPWELLAANESALGRCERRIDGDLHPDATVTGSVVLESGATIREGTTVEGPAYIAAGSSVGPNAYVRGATLIDRETNVGQGVEVKNSIVMRGAAIPHLSYVGDSIIGPEANLGAGTVIANLRHDREPVELTVEGSRVSTGREKFGAVVGPRAKTGVNTSINPGVTLSSGATTAPGETVARDR